MIRLHFAVAAMALALGGTSAIAAPLDFALGQNGESQACRAQAHFGQGAGRQVDIFCGEWDRPSGSATLLPVTERAQAEALLAADCQGEVTVLKAAAFSDMRQIACKAEAAGGLRRYGLIASNGRWVVVGTAYPADWAPLVRAGEVLTGAVAPAAAAQSGDSPGMREIQSVFPEGPPGQAKAFNYELLRRRAYEKNAIWNFGGSERDFSELLAAHRAMSPDDVDGEAEIMAEVGLNLSGEQRFDEAGETLRQAQAKAEQAGNALLASKIMNYRAIDLMNQRRYGEVVDLAAAANVRRARLMQGGGEGAFAISASDAAGVEQARQRRSLLVQMGEPSEAERAAILSAQGSYLAGAASLAMGKPGAERLLDQAEAQLAATPTPPAWLRAMIADQRAKARLARGDARGAADAATEGLQAIRASAPNTRAEAHLLLSLARAQRRAGAAGEALATGRRAVAIFAAQRESPGMPSDLAADQLDGLLAAWTQSRDPGLAAEYFETSALTWDGAAARSALQLAARLGAKEASGQARAYQDAERAYRAAIARRERLSATPDIPAEKRAEADAKVQAAAAGLAAAEGALRSASPRFLELLSPSVTAKDLAAALAPDEAYLRVILTPTGGYGVLVTRSAVTPYSVPLTEGDADRLVSRLRDSSRMSGRRLPDFDVGAAAELYQRLIAPVEPGLAGMKRLQVDAGGVLAAAPFAAFVTAAPSPAQLEAMRANQDYSGAAWLARSYAVAQSVGPASFVRLRHSASESVPAKATIFGDFQPDPRQVAERLASLRGLSPQCEEEVRKALARLAALPETASEVHQAAALFGGAASVRLGRDFTDANFLAAEDVGNASVIMLATHGVLGLSSCFAEPALIASLGPDGDGLIEASELLDRRLRARLVVLSACDTAGGGRADMARSGLSDGGEALSGLARGFLYAGASSVMATQWKVDSESSANEVRRFFEAALTKGEPMSAALAQAQASLYDVAETSHPFYWAAFTLIGDGGVTLAAPSRDVASQ
jgi:CHAT domain-containing protein